MSLSPCASPGTWRVRSGTATALIEADFAWIDDPAGHAVLGGAMEPPVGAGRVGPAKRKSFFLEAGGIDPTSGVWWGGRSALLRPGEAARPTPEPSALSSEGTKRR